MSLCEGDARTLLAGLADQSVDLVVTDPPYEFDRGTTYFREWFADLPDEVWPAILLELYRVLRADRHAYVICDERSKAVFADAATCAGFRLAKTLIWNKVVPGLGGGAYRSQREWILFLEKGRRPGNRRDLGDVLSFPRVMTRGHYPTEKPVGLLKVMIEQSSQPGELVLDPFCGSGSTGRVARELGRRALLCDLVASSAAEALRVAFVPLESAAATRDGRSGRGKQTRDESCLPRVGREVLHNAAGRVKDPPKRNWNIDEGAVTFTNADAYTRGSAGLHIHYRCGRKEAGRGLMDVCAVLECRPGHDVAGVRVAVARPPSPAPSHHALGPPLRGGRALLR